MENFITKSNSVVNNNNIFDMLSKANNNENSSLADNFSNTLIQSKGKYNVTDFYKASKEEQFETKFLFDSLILENTISVIFGDGGCGKSTAVRQMLLAFSYGYDDFLGFSINAENRNAALIITEESRNQVLANLQVQCKDFETNKTIEEPCLDIISDIFDDIEPTLEKILMGKAYKLIAIDTPQDFLTSQNDNSAVRKTMYSLKTIAEHYGCSLIFIFHKNKRTSDKPISADDLNGSQAIKNFARTLFELRKCPVDNTKALFTILKCNEKPDSVKENSMVLEMNENRNFFDTDIRIRKEVAHLTNSYQSIDEVIKIRVMELFEQKKENNKKMYNQTQIAEIINREFPNPKKKFLQSDVSKIISNNVQ